MGEEIETAAVREMRQLLRAWLERDDWEIRQLTEWLCGKGLPASDIDQEPYVWLLHGLPLADERFHAETELAARAARLLETQIDLHPPDKHRDELLYNLLMLCAGLSCPTQLAEQLYAILQRRRLTGSHQGISLRQALESALITNQRDDRLRDVWQEMIEGRRHEFLSGDEYAGFEGIRLMPTSEATRGEPALDAIGSALTGMIRHLATRRDRRLEFYRLMDRVLRTYPRQTWKSDLVHMAHEHNWPDWAVSCLPSLYIPLTSEDGWQVALLWDVFLVILSTTDAEYRIDGWLCNNSPMYDGLVAKVLLSEEACRFLKRVVPLAEVHRLNLQFSYKEVIGAVMYELSAFEVELALEPEKNADDLFKPENIRAACDSLRIDLGIMSAGIEKEARLRTLFS